MEEIRELDDFCLPLGELILFLLLLAEVYGPDAKLRPYAGYNNVTMCLEV